MSPMELHFLLTVGGLPSVPNHAIEDDFAQSCVRDGIMQLVTDASPYSKVHYQITEKGSAWIKLILKTPRPIELTVFGDAHGNIIE